MLLDLPPRPPPESEQPPPLQGRAPKVGAAIKGVAATIEDLNTALSLADEHGLSAEEKRKLKKKVCTAEDGDGVLTRVLFCFAGVGRGWQVLQIDCRK